MKKTFTKIFIIFITILGINLLMSISSTNINANSGDDARTVSLSNENRELRNKYVELQNRVIEIETELSQINDYDNFVYSQLMGIDVDSGDMDHYETDGIDFISTKYDSIFAYMDARTLNASKLATTKLNRLIETSNTIKKNKNILNYYPSISPIKTSDMVEITSPFGWRKHPIYKTQIFHDGIDISVALNTNVYSTMYGKVDKIMYSMFGYGNRIVIKNSQGFETLYAHLSKTIYVKKGQVVKKGQLIATSGNSGLSSGPHLHYEIRKNSELKDPLSYFYTYLTNELLAEK